MRCRSCARRGRGGEIRHCARPRVDEPPGRGSRSAPRSTTRRRRACAAAARPAARAHRRHVARGRHRARSRPHRRAAGAARGPRHRRRAERSTAPGRRRGPRGARPVRRLARAADARPAVAAPRAGADHRDRGRLRARATTRSATSLLDAAAGRAGGDPNRRRARAERDAAALGASLPQTSSRSIPRRRPARDCGRRPTWRSWSAALAASAGTAPPSCSTARPRRRPRSSRRSVAAAPAVAGILLDDLAQATPCLSGGGRVGATGRARLPRRRDAGRADERGIPERRRAHPSRCSSAADVDCLYLVTLDAPNGRPVVARRGALRGGGAAATIALPAAKLGAGPLPDRGATRRHGQPGRDDRAREPAASASATSACAGARSGGPRPRPTRRARRDRPRRASRGNAVSGFVVGRAVDRRPPRIELRVQIVAALERGETLLDSAPFRVPFAHPGRVLDPSCGTGAGSSVGRAGDF